jgi:hypothetical protein
LVTHYGYIDLSFNVPAGQGVLMVAYFLAIIENFLLCVLSEAGGSEKKLVPKKLESTAQRST